MPSATFWRNAVIVLVVASILVIVFFSLLPVNTLEALATANILLAVLIVTGISVPVLLFFLERWDKEKRKPKFSVQDPKPGTEYEIDVILPDRSVRKESAQFHFMPVFNLGEDSAVNVRPLLRLHGIPDPDRFRGLFPIAIIRPYLLDPRMAVQWKWKQSEFDEQKGKVAYALVKDEQFKRSIDRLDGAGPPEGFAILFTLKGSNDIYLPTVSSISLAMPCSFGLELLFHAEGLPYYRAATYEVAAQRWDSVKLTPVSYPKLRLGYVSVSQLSRKK